MRSPEIGCIFQEGRRTYRPVVARLRWDAGGFMNSSMSMPSSSHISSSIPAAVTTTTPHRLLPHRYRSSRNNRRRRGTSNLFIADNIFSTPATRLYRGTAAIHSGRRIAVATVRPPRTARAGPYPNLITIRLRFDSEHLVSSYLWKSESKDLTGWSSDLQFTSRVIVKRE